MRHDYARGVMDSIVSPHVAVERDGYWLLSWLPGGARLTERQAFIGMTLAELVAMNVATPDHLQWDDFEIWAWELGISREHAFTLIARTVEDGRGESALLTADVAMFHRDEHGDLRVLVIERLRRPFAGRWALPSSYLCVGEDSRGAAERTIREKEQLFGTECCTELVHVGAYDAPGRDPRGRVVTTVYAVAVTDPVTPAAFDDAEPVAEWVRVDELLSNPESMAFDHARIVADAAEAIRQKITGHEIEAGATITVDTILVHQDTAGELHVLLVERSQPIRGQLALPGGFVGAGERPEDAAHRELAEETGVAVDQLTLVGAHGHPGADPMDEVVKLVYSAIVPDMPAAVGGDDAIGARWVRFTPDLLAPGVLAFDHAELLTGVLAWARPQLAASHHHR